MSDFLSSIGGAVGGATPWGAIAQGVGGIAQAVGGAIQEHRAEKKYTKLINSYKPNESIMDYYNKALQRYNINPYTSAMYRQQTQFANRGLATGISALHKARGNDIAALVQGYNDAGLKAAVTAEGQQGQQLAQLGNAAAMKTQEEKYPFELKANMYAQKAAGGAQRLNAGVSNIFGAAQNIGNMQMVNRMYSDETPQSSDYGGGGVYSPSYEQAKRSGIFKYRG